MRNSFWIWWLAPISSIPTFPDPFRWLLNRLVLCDLLLILAFAIMQLCVAIGLSAAPNPWLELDADRSLPEFFSYAQWAICILSLGFAAAKRRDPALLTLTLIFVGLLWDDANSVHERAGFILVDGLGLTPGFGRISDGIGQILAFGTMAALAAFLGGLGYSFGRPFGRAVTVRFTQLFAGLILVGVGVDALHEASVMRFPGPSWAALHHALTAIEDGGEMLLGSVCAAYALTVARLPLRATG